MNNAPGGEGLGGPPRVQVFVPVTDVPREFGLCLQSLAHHLPADCTVYVLDCGTPQGAVQSACDQLRDAPLDLKYFRSEDLSGFVGICNWGFETLWIPGNDLLLLDPRTEVTTGFLEEMRAVAHLHEKHGVVTPRSNQAALFSFPLSDDPEPSVSYELWLKIRDTLPRYQIVPVAGSFCMFIKSEVLQRFGLFDDIYSPCHEQENDFACRINRCGYSALVANRAYVFQRDSLSSESGHRTLASEHRAILNDRYPEFDRRMLDYVRFQVDPVETFAPLYVPHRPRVLYDLYHLPPQHSGTSDFALNLLRELDPLMSKEYDLYVGAGKEQNFFLTELRGYRLYDEASSAPTIFDLVYKPCQLFSWSEFARMNRLSPRVAFTLLDIIAIRCGYISRTGLPELFRQTVELSDLVFSISEFSRLDYDAYYSAESQMRVIYLGSQAHPTAGDSAQGEYILIMGNAYAHKGVLEAVRQLQGDWPIVVLGGGPQPAQPNVRWLASGKLTRRYMHELFVRARVVVYPSYYEGYGLPVADSLAFGKPVVALDTAVNREIAVKTGDRNLHLVPSAKEFRPVVRGLWDEPFIHPRLTPRRWSDTAGEYFSAFQQIIGTDIDIQKMRRRWETVRLIESLGH